MSELSFILNTKFIITTMSCNYYQSSIAHFPEQNNSKCFLKCQNPLQQTLTSPTQSHYPRTTTHIEILSLISLSVPVKVPCFGDEVFPQSHDNMTIVLTVTIINGILSDPRTKI